MPWLIVVIWLISAGTGFWIFELRDQHPFESGAGQLFDTQARKRSAEAWYRAYLAAGSATSAATVVHFFKPDCSCNRFTEPHLAKIAARYRPQQVRFVAVTRAEVTSALGLATFRIPAAADLDWLDSAPAALVFDGAGHLVYFGPYSSAAWCGAGGGLVERILDRLLAGQRPELLPSYDRGCFCSR